MNDGVSSGVNEPASTVRSAAPHEPSIRSRIAVLVLVCIVPMWMLAVGVSQAFSRYVDDNEQQHAERAAALLLKAVEAEIASSLSALQVLAASPLIDDGDLGRWYGQALEVKQAHQALNVILQSPSLQTLVTLDRPFGQPAPRLPVDRLPAVIATGRPAVSDLFVGAIDKQPLVSLGVPVLRRGGAIARVEMIYTPQRFQVLLDRWNRPGNWQACLFDQRGQVIASGADLRLAGGPASQVGPPQCPRASPAAQASQFGWSVAVALQDTPFRSYFWWIQAALGLGALSLLAAGLLLGRWLGRRITDPIQALVEPALAIGRGEAARIRPGPLRETQALSQALSQAQALLSERERARNLAEMAEKEGRARLTLSLEAGGVGDWDLDLVTGRARTSLRHDQCFGYPDGLTQWTLAELRARVHPDDRDRVQQALKEATMSESPWQDEFRVIWPDQSEHWLASRGRCVFEDGRPSRLMGVVADITLRRQAFLLDQQRLELERENRRLQDTVMQRGRFFAHMSHELRTPLNAVIGFSDLLKLDGELAASKRALDYVEHIGEAGRHLLALVGDVLDLAKADAGRLELAPMPVQVDELCRKVLMMLRPLAEARSVSLNLDIDDDPAPLVLDPLRLRQVLYNLLSNAIKFSRSGAVVSLHVHSVDDAQVRFEVEDQGPGISEEDQARLFQEYEQLAEGRSQGAGGTGLGLALTRQLVELQGGSVGLRSTIGRGSVFFVTLPRTPPVRWPLEADSPIEAATSAASWRPNQ